MNGTTGQINVPAMKALMTNYTHLAAEDKARAVDLAVQCVAEKDKTLSMSGLLAFQASACMNRAVLMATDMKVIVGLILTRKKNKDTIVFCFKGCPRRNRPAATENQTESTWSNTMVKEIGVPASPTDSLHFIGFLSFLNQGGLLENSQRRRSLQSVRGGGHQGRRHEGRPDGSVTSSVFCFSTTICCSFGFFFQIQSHSSSTSVWGSCPTR